HDTHAALRVVLLEREAVVEHERPGDELLHRVEAEVQADGLLEPRVHLPLAIDFLREAELAAVHPRDRLFDRASHVRRVDRILVGRRRDDDGLEVACTCCGHDRPPVAVACLSTPAMTPSARRAAIRSGARPSTSRSTRSVCSPSAGGALHWSITPGPRHGAPGTRTRPASGVSMSRYIPRDSSCGSLTRSRVVLIGPHA